MIRVRIFIGFLLLGLVIQGALLLSGHLISARAASDEIPAKRQLVSSLGLTDLALWTEARYTRHPSQADLFSAFQDFPGSLDHFPAGSMIAPGPAGIVTRLRIRKSPDRGQK